MSHHPADDLDPADLGAAPRRRLEKLIDSGRFDVLSLDVFDTLLWRRVPEPHDAFHAMGERLLADWPQAPPDAASLFATERRLCEIRARYSVSGGECRLGPVYALMPRALFRDDAGDHPDLARAIDNEIAVERQVCQTDPDVEALAERARARGMKVILVSDTYFTAEQVAQVVAPFTADGIATSADAGCSKANGLLERAVTALGVEPRRVLHVGDTPERDRVGATRAGTEFAPWPYATALMERILEAELPLGTYQRRGHLNGAGQDLGLTRLRRRLAAHLEAHGAGFHRQYGATVLGPVLAGFFEWLLERLDGVKDVFFLLREGQVLADLMAPLAPPFRIHLLPASRYLAVKAAFDGSDDAWLEYFMRQQTPVSMAKVCRQFGIPPVYARLFPPGPDQPIQGEAAILEAIGYLCQPKISMLVEAEAAHTRRCLIERLSQHVDLSATEELVVVDLGYSGTIQRLYQRALRLEGFDVRFRGLYTLTFVGGAGVNLEGGRIEGFLSDIGQPESELCAFYRSPEVLEQVLMPDGIGSCLGFDGNGRLLEGRLPEELGPNQQTQRQAIAAIKQGITDFLLAWRAHRPEHGPGLADPTLRRHLRAILERSVAHPEAEEVEHFRHWQHDQNMGSDDSDALISPDGLEEARWLSPAALSGLGRGTLYWPHGAATLIGPSHRRDLHRALRRTAVTARPCPETDWTAQVLWNDGQGFGHPRLVSLRHDLNMLGRARLSFTLELDSGLAGLALSLGHADVVELCRVLVRHPSRTLELAGDELTDRLTGDGMTRLDGLLWRSQRPDLPLLVVPLPETASLPGAFDLAFYIRVLPR
ncbi:HAD family hydrolase [Roseospirillum parvum]|uniref:Predicted hydrolase, HAD superfamily n=1 Tax=Roseospirillum parvum TaxID=83401 RepID=A0A1G7TVY9_9PROT|nr:HAD family hydrolase [Roseospirillum parvum]SDG39497.1 Predicted hydrolase, HAD superfamily [Roseospirillum parvum]